MQIKDKVYYFASPYSNEDAYVREQRYLDALYAATELTKRGFTLIEPIAMSHQHSQRFGLPGVYEFWQERDRKFIQISDGVIVLTIPGWQESKGVTDEIQFAKSIGRPVYYCDLLTLTIRKEAPIGRTRAAV